MKKLSKSPKTLDEMMETVKRFPIKPSLPVKNDGEWFPGELLPFILIKKEREQHAHL